MSNRQHCVLFNGINYLISISLFFKTTAETALKGDFMIELNVLPKNKYGAFQELEKKVFEYEGDSENIREWAFDEINDYSGFEITNGFGTTFSIVKGIGTDDLEDLLDRLDRVFEMDNGEEILGALCLCGCNTLDNALDTALEEDYVVLMGVSTEKELGERLVEQEFVEIGDFNESWVNFEAIGRDFSDVWSICEINGNSLAIRTN